jgi:hypothetical protein
MARHAKLPVVDTIADTFSFASKRFLTVFKVMLIPSIVLLGPILLVVVTQLGDLMATIVEFAEQAEAGGEPSEEQVEQLVMEILPFYGIILLMMPLQLLYAAMIAVPIHRAIVLDEKPGLFRLDGFVWRYFFGQIVFFLLILAIIVGVFVPMGLGIAALEESGVDEIATIGVVIASLALLVFLLVRLSLFLVEVSVEGKFNVSTSFS